MSRRKKLKDKGIDPNINPETGRGWGIDETGNCTENGSPATFFLGQMMGWFCWFMIVVFGVMTVEQLVFVTTGNDFGFTHGLGTYESR